MSREAFAEFATSRMCFIEICPYASGAFGAEHAELIGQLEGDTGFKLNSRFREEIVGNGQPAVILANGNRVVEDFEKVDGQVSWTSKRYASEDEQVALLRWSPGTYQLPSGSNVPIVGFPFLNKAKSANSHGEYGQLGRKIERFLDTGETDDPTV